MTTRSNNLGAYILIGLGVLFLAGQIFDFDIGRIFDISWPLFVVIPGVIFLIIHFMFEKPDVPPAASEHPSAHQPAP